MTELLSIELYSEWEVRLLLRRFSNISIFFNLTPTKLFNVEDSTSPLHVERGSRVSENRRIRWGEVEIYKLRHYKDSYE
jgi:hypothetical protein